MTMEEIKKLRLGEKGYPLSLTEIDQPARVLYLRGQMPTGEGLAIVGTRRCSDYGKEMALTMAYDLAKAGLVIVSGLARGIDAFGHEGCLEAKGKTIAVLATGLDEASIYPKENLGLAQRILENQGCLISEYPPGTPGLKQYFPQRNRLIAGLSLGVVVVEAPLKSGGLITAHWAKTQRKPVFCLPGPVYSRNSQGPHRLIQKGAFLITGAHDILEILGKKRAQRGLLKTIFSSPEKENEHGDLVERTILEVLASGPLHVDKIIERIGRPASKVLGSLTLLEMENKIRNLGANVFALKRKN